MRKNFIIFFLLLISQVVLSQNQYSLSKDLEPIKIKFSDFNYILENLSHLIQKYDSLSRYAGESFIIENENTKMIFGESSSVATMSFNKAYRASYQWSNARGSIFKVDIDLGDYSRKVTVSGRNLLELETLINYLEKELYKFRQPFGGSIFRIQMIFVLFFIIFIISGTAFFELRNAKIIQREKTLNVRLYLSAIIYVFTLMCMAGVFNFKLIFPGFLMYTDDTSFISRNADLFTFLGFLLGLLGIVGTPLFRKRKI